VPKLQNYRPVNRNNYKEPLLWAFDSKPKSIYIAASTVNQATALRLALRLQRAGFEITSRWLEFDFSEYTERDPWLHRQERERCELWGKRDVEDLEKADTLVLLSNVPSSKGGFHVELGYFLGKGRNVLVVGEKPNVFFWTDPIRFMLDTEDVADFLSHPDHGKVPPTYESFEVTSNATIQLGEEGVDF